MIRRADKIAEQIREEVTQIVGYELDDPRIGLVTITDVQVTDNLRDARVYVTVAGTDEEVADSLAALRRAANFVRKQLGLSLKLRSVPHLHFVRDTVEEQAARVEELLLEVRKAEGDQQQRAELLIQGEEGEEMPPATTSSVPDARGQQQQ